MAETAVNDANTDLGFDPGALRERHCIERDRRVHTDGSLDTAVSIADFCRTA